MSISEEDLKRNVSVEVSQNDLLAYAARTIAIKFGIDFNLAMTIAALAGIAGMGAQR